MLYSKFKNEIKSYDLCVLAASSTTLKKQKYNLIDRILRFNLTDNIKLWYLTFNIISLEIFQYFRYSVWYNMWRKCSVEPAPSQRYSGSLWLNWLFFYCEGFEKMGKNIDRKNCHDTQANLSYLNCRSARRRRHVGEIHLAGISKTTA